MEERKILSFKESADYLRVSGQTLRRWVADGKVFPARLGKGRVVFTRVELDRFVETSTKKPLAA